MAFLRGFPRKGAKAQSRNLYILLCAFAPLREHALVLIYADPAQLPGNGFTNSTTMGEKQ
jgi:hypothetical protein